MFRIRPDYQTITQNGKNPVYDSYSDFILLYDISGLADCTSSGWKLYRHPDSNEPWWNSHLSMLIVVCWILLCLPYTPLLCYDKTLNIKPSSPVRRTIFFYQNNAVNNNYKQWTIDYVSMIAKHQLSQTTVSSKCPLIPIIEGRYLCNRRTLQSRVLSHRP